MGDRVKADKVKTSKVKDAEQKAKHMATVTIMKQLSLDCLKFVCFVSGINEMKSGDNSDTLVNHIIKRCKGDSVKILELVNECKELCRIQRHSEKFVNVSEQLGEYLISEDDGE